jgi:hypothetical protein
MMYPIASRVPTNMPSELAVIADTTCAERRGGNLFSRSPDA